MHRLIKAKLLGGTDKSNDLVNLTTGNQPILSQIRRQKLPDPELIPNAGSFFKNPIISAADFEHLKTITNNQALGPVPFYLQPCGAVKIPAAWLIDKAGLKGTQVKGLQIHAKQALVLTNPNAMPLKAVLQASDEITHIVKQRFNVILEREPQILG